MFNIGHIGHMKLVPFLAKIHFLLSLWFMLKVWPERKFINTCSVTLVIDTIKVKHVKPNKHFGQNPFVNPIRPGLLAQTWGPGGGCITPPH
jgi:hypothetical protein